MRLQSQTIKQHTKLSHYWSFMCLCSFMLIPPVFSSTELTYTGEDFTGIGLTDPASINKPITFTTSNSIEPYFFIEKKGGLQYNLLISALQMNHLELGSITYATNLRALRLVKTKEVDCIINAPSTDDGLFLTQSLIEYQNSLFYLTKNKLKIDTVNDLKKYSLIAFQNASQYLGDEFIAASTQHQDYTEIASQKSQVLMLFSEHTQMIILEQRIFDHYRHKLQHRIKDPFEVTQMILFNQSPRYIACHDQQTAILVDEAISQLKQSNLYQQILLDAEQGKYNTQYNQH
ncbi:amino acid ABC transporter [Shewanella sp. OMA3-2]|uniref:amino acid ABC transporter n=1 Tax=Shewanella sp. OMA3-2 TaxID=2908650 RepID=UPI001F236206|nr:amino acid ABC transporter [Shewanella sp. OMA3-2]UJF22862.1 amino acid ABC transporter [Shewanella sp. OMA3-2]